MQCDVITSGWGLLHSSWVMTVLKLREREWWTEKTWLTSGMPSLTGTPLTWRRFEELKRSLLASSVFEGGGGNDPHKRMRRSQKGQMLMYSQVHHAQALVGLDTLGLRLIFCNAYQSPWFGLSAWNDCKVITFVAINNVKVITWLEWHSLTRSHEWQHN